MLGPGREGAWDPEAPEEGARLLTAREGPEDTRHRAARRTAVCVALQSELRQTHATLSLETTATSGGEQGRKGAPAQ